MGWRTGRSRSSSAPPRPPGRVTVLPDRQEEYEIPEENQSVRRQNDSDRQIRPSDRKSRPGMTKPTRRTSEESSMIVLCSLSRIPICRSRSSRSCFERYRAAEAIDRTGGNEEEQGYDDEPGQNCSRQPGSTPLRHRYITLPRVAEIRIGHRVPAESAWRWRPGSA